MPQLFTDPLYIVKPSDSIGIVNHKREMNRKLKSNHKYKNGEGRFKNLLRISKNIYLANIDGISLMKSYDVRKYNRFVNFINKYLIDKIMNLVPEYKNCDICIAFTSHTLRREYILREIIVVYPKDESDESFEKFNVKYPSNHKKLKLVRF